jgi:predicted aspartyl protease
MAFAGRNFRSVYFTRLVVFLLPIALLFASPVLSRSNISDSLLPQIHAVHLFSDPIVSSDSTSVIPFTRAGNLILIQARADSIVGNFILDTGAPNLVLNMTYFRSYSTINSSDQEQTGLSGSASNRIQIQIDEFSFGNIKYNRVEADLTNLGQIENSKGVKILGLLGIQLFRQFELIIDYEKSLIYLHLISKKEAKTYKSELLNDTSAYSVIPFDITDNKIITKLEIGGKKLRFIIDCGAETNLLDSRLPNNIFENVEIGRRVILRGADDKKTEALYGNLKNMKIGNQQVSSLPILITNLQKSCLSYISCTDGILGFDFLSLHKIGFNFVKRKMYIWK